MHQLRAIDNVHYGHNKNEMGYNNIHFLFGCLNEVLNEIMHFLDNVLVILMLEST